MGRVFERECDAYISVRPCVEGEPMCMDNRANEGEPFFFFYQTVFKRIRLCLPFSNFERELLTEINVAPAQLHPNSWAFIRVFTILYNHFGHPPPSTSSFISSKPKNPGRTCGWASTVSGIVFLTLFQSSYKGFKGKFFRVCNSEHGRTSLDEFPLYWVGELKLKKAKTLDELSSTGRGVWQVLASLGLVFNIVELIKCEYDPSRLTSYI